MSGPVRTDDLGEDPPADHPGVTATEGRRTIVGGMPIVRVLPTKGRRTVGAWCFVDCMGPDDAAEPDPMEVGPHPHIGLSTATWLFSGEAVHGDSLGTEQLLRPGQLNLMTAGRGIAHAELGLGQGTGSRALSGIQLWIAQPESTRHGDRAFAHHGDLPVADLPGAGGTGGAGRATVFVGELLGATSPARRDTPLVGAELAPTEAASIPVDPAFEHAIVPIGARVLVDGAVVEPGWLGHVAPGRHELRVEPDPSGPVRPDARVMLLGGEPFERVAMWWNFVARTQDELTEAWRDWQGHDDDRFPQVPSGLERIDAPTPPWVRG